MKIDSAVNSRCCNRLQVSEQKLASFCSETLESTLGTGCSGGQRRLILPGARFQAEKNWVRSVQDEI